MLRSVIAVVASAHLCEAGRPDPAYSKNMTLYHINPLNASGIENMDLADPAGDLFFEMTVLSQPYSCPSPYAGCDNREIIGHGIGVKQVTVEVDQRFGYYGACNICVNGTDPRNTSKSCHGDEYVCDCRDVSQGFPPKSVECSSGVGREYPRDFFGNKGVGKFCIIPGKPANCWGGHAAEELNGTWYSPTTLGKCSEDDDKPCTWRLVEETKVVTRDCHLNKFHTTVEKEMDSSCIDACTDSGVGPQRNTSSKCWTKCWFDAALGKQASHFPLTTPGGMGKDALLAAWLQAFKDESEGGCARYTPPKSIIV